MATLATDFIPINRGGTIGTANSGAYHIGTVQSILDLVPGAGTIVSATAGNLITDDTGAFLDQAVIQANETTTALSYVAGTQTLTYTDEDGAPTNIDLSGLTTDVFVSGASVAAGVVTFTPNDAGTGTDFTIDFSTYYNALTDNVAAGTFTATTAGGAATVVNKTAWMNGTAVP